MTALDLSMKNLEDDIEDFQMKLERVDLEKVEKLTLSRTARDLAEMVAMQVVQSSKINSPADTGPYESGSGPSMSDGSRKGAWMVKRDGRSNYTIKPHPLVRQRAIVLNYGYPGEITPTSADYMRFTVDGVPRFRKSVPGPEAAGYWEAAMNQLRSSGKLEKNGEIELRNEMEEHF